MAESVKFLYSRFLSASTLIGAQVRNPQDESLGDLKDAMIDTASGKVAYGVLSFGGVLGVGNKLFAVPMIDTASGKVAYGVLSFDGVLGVGNKLFAVPGDAFRVDPENERLVLDVPKDRLKDAPGFDADHWPNLADPNVAGEVNRRFGTTASGEHRILHPD